MKKIFLFLASVFALFACDPVSEDISNGGHITLDQLKEMSTCVVDKAPSGKNGNVITCETKAPVNAKWDVGGKVFKSTYAWKKMKLGTHKVTLTALCADGTELSVDYSIDCEETTNQLEKFWIYGSPEKENEKPFTPAAWNAADMRFSDNEGNYLPYLSDDIYAGKKTLIFELTDVSDDCVMKVMNGWWSATYYDNVNIANEMKDGKWELQLTDAINEDCSKAKGAKDLDLMLYSGTMTVHSVYYEE